MTLASAARTTLAAFLLLAGAATLSTVRAESSLAVEVRPDQMTLDNWEGGFAGFWGNSGEFTVWTYLGQTFQVPNAVDRVLLSFTAFVGRQQAATDGAPFEYQALVWRYDPDTETVVDPPLYTGPATTIPASVPMLPDYASVTAFFGAGLELQAGATYMFALKALAAGGAGGLVWAAASTDPYASGSTVFSLDAATWYPDASQDLAFSAVFGGRNSDLMLLKSLADPNAAAAAAAGSGGEGQAGADAVQAMSGCGTAGITLHASAPKTVTAGKKVRVSVAVGNTNDKGGPTFDNAGIAVTLPAGVTFSRAYVRPRPKDGSGQPQLAGNVLTFADGAPLPPRKARRYTVVVRTSATLAAGAQLTFAVALANCPLQAPNVQVTVKRK